MKLMKSLLLLSMVLPNPLAASSWKLVNVPTRWLVMSEIDLTEADQAAVVSYMQRTYPNAEGTLCTVDGACVGYTGVSASAYIEEDEIHGREDCDMGPCTGSGFGWGSGWGGGMETGGGGDGPAMGSEGPIADDGKAATIKMAAEMMSTIKTMSAIDFTVDASYKEKRDPTTGTVTEREIHVILKGSVGKAGGGK